MNFNQVLNAFALILLAPGVSTVVADEIGEFFQEAEEAYEMELSVLDQQMIKLLDDREAIQRANGNRKSVESVKSERQNFTETGELPGWAPIEQIAGRLETRGKVVTALERAIMAYTMNGQDNKALEMETKRDLFHADSQLLMSFEHEVRNRRQQPTGSGVVKLYSNLTAEFQGMNVVGGKSTWTLNKLVMEFHWDAPKTPNGFQIDRVRLSRDGKTYSGKNVTSDVGATVHGKRIGFETH